MSWPKWLTGLVGATAPRKPVEAPPPPAAIAPQPRAPKPAGASLRSRTEGFIAGAFPSLSIEWVNGLSKAMESYEIDDTKQMPAFIAQCIAESGGLSARREILNYSVAGLLAGFGRHRISSDDASRLGRSPNAPPLSTVRQALIANIVYGGEYGLKNLGNTKGGDGWYFRGGGLLQLTGRANWTGWANNIRISVDQAANYIMTPEGAADSAAWFWLKSGCAPLAKALPEIAAEQSQQFLALTIKINGGTNGLEHRRDAYRKIKAAMPAAQ